MTTSSYDERLVVPWSWWLVGLGVALVAALQIHGGASGARAVVPYVLLPGLVAVALVLLSRKRVHVAHGVLHVSGARAPVSAFGPVEVLDRSELRLWLGARAHRDAWVAVPPWIGGAVRVTVVDPGDETPYWLVATRDPVRLAAVLRSDTPGGS